MTRPLSTLLKYILNQWNSTSPNPLPGDDGVPVDYIEKLADLLEKHVDLDAILQLAGSAEARTPTSADVSSSGSDSPTSSLTDSLPPLLPSPSKIVRIGVARDAAFCFYYHENLALLQGEGIRIVLGLQG
jgi:cobyrinic acid a,c-diamide synthase